MRTTRAALAMAAVVTAVAWAAPAPASAASPAGVLCTLTGLVSGALGKVCTVATHAGRVVGAGRKLLGGHVGAAVDTLIGGGSSKVATATTAAVGLAAIAAAVAGGARYLLRATAKIIGATTRPNLTSTWFSATYWRMAAISALVTLPFLFAAAVHALIRSDLALLGRAAFGYLPLAMLAVGVAAPLTALLLSGADEMSALVASASGHAGADFLDRAAGLGGAVGLFGGSLFVSFFVALLTATATIALWAELLIRDAAVYVMVLMLPLFFAAMVWPARRVWATRAVELLVALILSKFVIVAVLTLGGAALGHSLIPGPASVLTGMTLVILAATSPWALMRLLPLQELAGAAAGGLRHEVMRPVAGPLATANDLDDRLQQAPQLDEHVRPRRQADPAPEVRPAEPAAERGPQQGEPASERGPQEGEPATEPAETGGDVVARSHARAAEAAAQLGDIGDVHLGGEQERT